MHESIDPINLIDSITIPHEAFAHGHSLIERAIRCSNGLIPPKCVAILGPSGAGKSRLLVQSFEGLPKARRENDGMSVPAFLTKVPPKPTPKALASALIKALGAPDFTRGTEPQLIYRAEILMRECGVRAVGLDDIHHFVDQSSINTMHHAADMLKNLTDTVKCSLILTGLPYSSELLNLNEQLARRFMAPVLLDRFLWQVSKDREEFLDTLTSFEEGMKQKHFKLPALGSVEMGFRFYCASGGLIGYVAKILEWVVQTAVVEGRLAVTISDFERGYREAVWKQHSSLVPVSPFAWGRAPEITEDLLKTIQAFGKPGVPQLRRPSLKGGVKEASLANILTRT
jgi:energy-coupling factor transporter ATP-binding protein EcfA2